MQHTTIWPGRPALAPASRRAARRRDRNPRWMGWPATAAVVAAALTVAACGSSPPNSGTTPSSGAAASGNVLKTTTINGVSVLTNGKGFTLYSFAPDTPSRSNCNGQCAKFWPPLKGPVTGSGIKGTFGTIKRSSGAAQATFDGHPLYTYVGDKSPGQATGNGLNLSGGVWHEVTASGTAAPAGNSSSGGSGGYGY
jgi:predicted lipoprotein with Yx(FWY)xxD motif